MLSAAWQYGNNCRIGWRGREAFVPLSGHGLILRLPHPLPLVKTAAPLPAPPAPHETAVAYFARISTNPALATLLALLTEKTVVLDSWLAAFATSPHLPVLEPLVLCRWETAIRAASAQNSPRLAAVLAASAFCPEARQMLHSRATDSPSFVQFAPDDDAETMEARRGWKWLLTRDRSVLADCDNWRLHLKAALEVCDGRPLDAILLYMRDLDLEAEHVAPPYTVPRTESARRVDPCFVALYVWAHEASRRTRTCVTSLSLNQHLLEQTLVPAAFDNDPVAAWVATVALSTLTRHPFLDRLVATGLATLIERRQVGGPLSSALLSLLPPHLASLQEVWTDWLMLHPASGPQGQYVALTATPDRVDSFDRFLALVAIPSAGAIACHLALRSLVPRAILARNLDLVHNTIEELLRWHGPAILASPAFRHNHGPVYQLHLSVHQHPERVVALLTVLHDSISIAPISLTATELLSDPINPPDHPHLVRAALEHILTDSLSLSHSSNVITKLALDVALKLPASRSFLEDLLQTAVSILAEREEFTFVSPS